MRDIESMRRANAGVSLIELLISVAIGLFLVAVVGGVYLSSKQSFTYQDAMSRLQENARFAMEAMARDIRMAGYSGCGNLSKVANTVNGGASNWWLNFSAPVIGYDGLSASQTQFPGAVAGTDAIVLIGVGDDELSVISHNANAATIQTTQHAIKPGAILVITDCSQTSVFQMSGPTNNNANATNVNHNTGNAVSPGNCNKELGASCPTAKAYTFRPGSSLLQMYANGYYIRPSATANNGNALWVCSISGQTGGVADCSELINGVENMQIMYGVDSDGDRSADRYLDASAVANWGQVVSVRVSLLMATPPSAGTLSSTAQTYTYNGTSSTATDRRVRHVYSSTVNVRNRTN
jgi:type IV pilus assembly protein PilW